MRQATVVSILRRFSFPILLVIMIVLLAIFGNIGIQKDTVESDEVQNSNEATGQSAGSTSSASEEDSKSDKKENKKKFSSKVKVSIHTSTSNNETNGSANVEVTKDGEKSIIHESFDGGSVKIDIEGGEIDIEEDGDGHIEVDFDSRTRTKTENESSIEQDIEEESD